MYVEFGSMFWDKFCLVFKNRIIHKSQTPFIKIVDFWDCHLHNWKNQSVFAHTNGLVSSAHAWPVATLCAIAQKRGETGIIPILQFPNCKNRRNLGRRVKRTTPQRWITKKNFGYTSCLLVLAINVRRNNETWENRRSLIAELVSTCKIYLHFCSK